MSQDKLKKSIQMVHEWRFQVMGDGNSKFVPMHSHTFVHESISGVKLNIHSARSDVGAFDVVVSKTPSNPANVCIIILVDGREKKRTNIDRWIDDCIIRGVPYCFDVSDFSYRGEPRTCFGTIRFLLTWNGFVEEYNPPVTNLYNETKCLLTSSAFSDIVIMVKDQKILAHKVILAIQSPIFEAMFRTNMKESANNRVDIKDIPANTMKKVIEFLYTGILDKHLGVDVLLSILAAADKYQIMKLKDLCEIALCTKITLNTALEILENANLYGVPQLIEKTITFMVKYKQNIVQSENFKSLHERKPHLFWEFIIRIVTK